MNILCVTSNFEHPVMGGSTRYYHFIKAWSQRHRITLLARAKSSVPRSVRDEMARYTEQVLTVGATPADMSRPRRRLDHAPGGNGRLQRLWRRRCALAEVKKAFARLVSQNRYDLVVVRGENVLPVAANCRSVPLVIDIADANSLRVFQSLRYAHPGDLPWRFLRYLVVRRKERKFIRTTPYVSVMSSRDREAMRMYGACARLIPNGVDLEYWTRTIPPDSSPCIVFTGVMTYPPNEDGALHLLEDVLPLVRRSVPQVRLVIVGRDPSSTLVKAAGRSGATVTGYVPDVRPYLERASVVAAPIRFASGIQNKVLEALAMQVPVVTTSVVAAGLREAGRDEPPLAVADDARAFAQHLVDLITNPTECARLATCGRAYVQRYFDWSRSAALMEAMCLDAVAAGARRRSC
jgi:glycosyltransferase involved in cell wall biosynthesis